MKTLQSIATIFLLAVATLCVLGWRWAATLPPAKMEGARLVLVLSGLSVVAAMGLIWRIKSPRRSA